MSCIEQNIHINDYEIIIVNDGSKDNSIQIAKEISESYKNIKIISQENQGLSAARNAGVKHAIGDYYLFLDSDDWLAQNCLEKVLYKLNTEHPDVLAFCAANVFDNKVIRRKYYLDDNPISGIELLHRGVESCATFAVWNAKFLNENSLSFYKGIFHEDEEFTPRAYYFAHKVSLLNDIIYFVRQNPNSITRSFNMKKSYDLVKIVCPNLFKFSQNIELGSKKVFYNRISNLVGGAIANARYADVSEKNNLYNMINESNFLFIAMRESGRFRHRLMSKLFKLYPKNMLFAYDIVQALLWLPVKIKGIIRFINPIMFYK